VGIAMTHYFISRHPGTIEWAKRRSLKVTHFVAHLDADQVQAGDTVTGNLPVHLAAQVCAKGAAYWHIRVALPAAMRGKELSADDLEQLQARVEQFSIQIIQRPQ
jgi:CRISPR-associated protein Csx16